MVDQMACFVIPSYPKEGQSCCGRSFVKPYHFTSTVCSINSQAVYLILPLLTIALSFLDRLDDCIVTGIGHQVNSSYFMLWSLAGLTSS